MVFVTSRGLTSGIIAVAFSLAGCAAQRSVSGGASSNVGRNFAATEAAYRYLFANNGSAFKDRASLFCVGAGERPRLTDPDPKLIKALSDVRPPVVPISVCRKDARTGAAGHEPVLIFNLALVRCARRDDCLFTGGYYEGNLSASQGHYRAQRSRGAWHVTAQGPQAIS